MSSNDAKTVWGGQQLPDRNRVLPGFEGTATQRQSDGVLAEGRSLVGGYEIIRRTTSDLRRAEQQVHKKEAVIAGADERVLVFNPAAYPLSSICALRMRQSGVGITVYGTGTLIGKRVVLTAGHNVFNRDRSKGRIDWFTEVEVIPGLNGSVQTTPFEMTKATLFATLDRWKINGDDDHDLGAIILPTDLGATTGWMGTAVLADGALNGLAVQIAGYPVACPNKGSASTPICASPGTSMWWHAGNVLSFSTLGLRYSIDTSGGQSGAPVFSEFEGGKYNIVGVHTESVDFFSNGGIRIGNLALQRIQEWLSAAAT